MAQVGIAIPPVFLVPETFFVFITRYLTDISADG